MNDKSITELRNVDELVGKNVVLTEQELYVYLFGVEVTKELIRNLQNKNRFREILIRFLTAPKTIELIILTFIMGSRNIPFKRLVK